MKIKKYLAPVKTALFFSLAMFLICGLIYPLALTGISQLVFPSQANGSLVYVDGKAVGSKLIGQDFTDPKFMKCRPSAVNYNVYTEEAVADGSYGGVSTGSKNYAPTNPELVKRVEQDIETFLANNPTVEKGDIPADLLTASGSGLDPHISPDSAKIQVAALVENTGLTEAELTDIISNNTDGKLLGIFGEETVNVLMVNLDIAKAIGITA